MPKNKKILRCGDCHYCIDSMCQATDWRGSYYLEYESCDRDTIHENCPLDEMGYYDEPIVQLYFHSNIRLKYNNYSAPIELYKIVPKSKITWEDYPNRSECPWGWADSYDDDYSSSDLSYRLKYSNYECVHSIWEEREDPAMLILPYFRLNMIYIDPDGQYDPSDDYLKIDHRLFEFSDYNHRTGCYW